MIRKNVVFNVADGIQIRVPVAFDAAAHIEDFHRLQSEAILTGRIAQREQTDEAWKKAGAAHLKLYGLILGDEVCVSVAAAYHDYAAADISGMIGTMNQFINKVVTPYVCRQEQKQRAAAQKDHMKQRRAMLKEQKRQVK